jgi:hypothetical protein
MAAVGLFPSQGLQVCHPGVEMDESPQVESIHECLHVRKHLRCDDSMSQKVLDRLIIEHKAGRGMTSSWQQKVLASMDRPAIAAGMNGKSRKDMIWRGRLVRRLLYLRVHACMVWIA